MEFEKIKNIIVEVLNVEEDSITMESKFTDDLGADSLDIFQIIMGVEEEFEIEIANEDAEKIVTVGDAVEQITIKTPSGVKTRVDAIGLDTNGNVVIQEYKSSLTAPLTNNQARAFPEIFESGGVVVGKGKGIFTGGYQIPAGTEVTMARPN